MSKNTKVAIIGSGNIGTDLMMKIARTSNTLALTALVGIDAASNGLKLAQELGVSTTAEGIDGLTRMPEWQDIEIVFDATSAQAHRYHDTITRAAGKTILDLTPAALGPYVIPVVNGAAVLDSDPGILNLNMVTCGGQATIPVVAAVSRVAEVHYAEIVASIASRSAGPGTRANIDEFTETTAAAIVAVGGAAKGKAIIVLNPAEPPMIMRDTVLTLCSGATEEAIESSVLAMIGEVSHYVPGYRLKQKLQFEHFGPDNPAHIPGHGTFEGIKTTIFLEVEGAAHYLPAYAGNLDIMTSAALATAEQIASHRQSVRQPRSEAIV
ncbi:MAG: acetaldehyde dehydrogenase (acetylating) [Congregibacter sp.]